MSAGTAGTETCNGVDDDCDGSIDEDLYRDAPNQLGICAGNREYCDLGDWEPLIGQYTFPQAEACPNDDGLDEDCDGLVDEYEWFCEGSPYDINCNGEVACGDFSRDACPTGIGCERVLGQCEVSRYLCAHDSDCPPGENCLGGSCEGYASCLQFTDENACENTWGGYCSWDGCDANIDRTSCDAAGPQCSFSCTDTKLEICSNGVDDDDDGLVDCADTDCQVSVPLSQDQVDERFNCLGSPQTGDNELPWFCSVNPLVDASVGLCCPQDFFPYELLGQWECRRNNPCDPAAGFTCGYDYLTEFDDWILSRDFTGGDWCVAPGEQRACCPVVYYARSSYWDDAATENVKVY